MKIPSIFLKQYSSAVLSVILFFLLPHFSSCAQESYKAQQSKLVMSGTSTLHDWKMTAEGFNCTTLFKLENSRVIEAKSLQLTVPVKSLKSGKGAMDKNAYAALKEETFKQISYSLTSVKYTDEKLLCTGNLTIAGVIKPVEVASTCSVESDQSIVCQTSAQLKMTDFNVEPPSFMFGSVTTGDKITLEFKLIFKKVNQSSSL